MKKLLPLLLALTCLSAVAQKSWTVTAPDGKLKAHVVLDQGALTYSITHQDRTLTGAQPLAMHFDNGVTAGEHIRSLKATTRAVNETITPPVAIKTAQFEARANELVLNAGNYSVIFRVAHDAVAYRFTTNFKEKQVNVLSETVCYSFLANDAILFPEETSFYTHQERKFLNTTVGAIDTGRFCSPPMLVTHDGVRMLVSEVDLEAYPGIFYRKASTTSFNGIFPHLPKQVAKRSDRNMVVQSTQDYLATCSGTRSYPWRVALVTTDDRKLLESTTLYSLAAPSRLADASWIRPGKIAWDWWNGNNLTGVAFKTGINTDTYKAFVDFAAQHKLEYIVLDEGWYDIKKTILDVVPELDMEALLAYAQSKNVEVILWATWLALEERMDEALAQFHQWGIKGIKVDFMQRSDAPMVEWYYSTAEKAAALQLMVDYHGAYTPRGLNRTWPNVITFEGVYGLEQNKWAEDLTPEHNVTLPFTRMVVGPMDYTPGAMRNVLPSEFKANFFRPMSIGTRGHQLGMYVVYESPLQMLSDTPSAYAKEPETMRFLGPVPSVWDETKAIAAQVGDYVVVARRSGQEWYVGGMTDGTARTIDVAMDFLGEGDYELTLWKDGVNAARHTEDLAVETQTVNRSSLVKITMAPGGGFAGRIGKR